MSDEREAPGSKKRRSATTDQRGGRSYVRGGSATGTRKADAPSAWVYTPATRTDAYRRGSSKKDR